MSAVSLDEYPAGQNVPARDISHAYARLLLGSLNASQSALEAGQVVHPALVNARSGLMALTGEADGIAQLCPVPIAACADGVLKALRSLAPESEELSDLSGAQLLTERAAIMGLKRNGRTAPGGFCRLLDTADGRMALNLAREDDWALLPAWLETEALDGAPDQWQAVQAVVAERKTTDLVERARQLGLPVAQDAFPTVNDGWYTTIAQGPKALPRKQPLVLDLSTLWAGPLCTSLLQHCGARVIKLESTMRPDGARLNNSKGHRAFYDLLNAGKASVSIDLNSESGRQQLRALMLKADIVVESARPRGLRQMGIVAEEIMAARPGLSWISITGYGREGEQGEWVGFGDDAGASAGLCSLMEAVTGEPCFVGDAIADPLTGLHAALAAWHSHINGGGQLLSLGLAEVTGHCVGYGLPATADELRQRYRHWSKTISAADIQPPRPRYAASAARSLGADTQTILAEFGLLH